MSELPLAGIRVIDITVVWSGPSACRMLAALGAEVIRIESIHHFPATSRGQVPYPDPAAIAAAVGAAAAYPGKDPGPDPYNRFGPFLATNQGKLSVTMELDTPEGTEAFHRLVGCSDVLVENNARAAGDGLGITWPALRPLNSRLVMVRMAPLGLDGPYANALGYGAHFEALTGIGALRGHPGAAREDAGSTYHMDDVAPQGVVFAVLAALMQRERTGAGQLIEFPQGEFLMQGIGDAFVAESMNGESYSPQGNRHPAWVQGIYPCRGEDQWIALTHPGRRRVGSAAGRDRAPGVGRRPALRLADLLPRAPGRAGPPAGRVHGGLGQARAVPGPAAGRGAGRPGDGRSRRLRRPALRAAPDLPAGDQPGRGHPHVPRPGRALVGDDAGLGRPSPLVGQDNEYVYKKLLGYTDAEYDDLAAAGLIGNSYPRPS